MKKQFVQAPEVAAMLGITITHVRDLAKAGKLPCRIEEDQSRPRYWFSLNEILEVNKSDKRDLAKATEHTRLVRIQTLEMLFNIPSSRIRDLAHNNVIPNYSIGNSLWFDINEVSGKLNI